MRSTLFMIAAVSVILTGPALAADPLPIDYAQAHHFTTPRPSVITLPDRVGGVAADDLQKAYPVKAQRLRQNGSAELECKVSMAGANYGCVVLAETPEGLGFGAAALKVAALMTMRPATKDGAPVDGVTVRLPINFTGFADQPAVKAVAPPRPSNYARAGTYADLPPQLAGMRLPTGRLGLVGVAADRGAYFVALDQEVWSAGAVQIDLLDIGFSREAYRPSIALVSRYRVDCAAKTAQDVGSVFLDANNRVSGWSLPNAWPGAHDPHPYNAETPAGRAAILVCEKSTFAVQVTTLEQATNIAVFEP